MSDWSIREVPVPASLDAPEAWLLHGSIEADHESVRAAWGNLDHAQSPHEILTALRHQQYVRRVRLVAVTGDDTDPGDPARVLGTAILLLPLADNLHLGIFFVSVRPGSRGRGIGSALYDAVVEVATAAGRTTLQTSTDQRSDPDEGPGTLAPSTGTGRVRANDAGVRFAVAHGFALEQVARYSVLDVPVDPALLAEHRAAAQAVAGDEYRIVTWGNHCPDEWVDEFAVLNTRMSTDAPAGGLDVQEDAWDAERIRVYEQDFAERGMEFRVTAAEHVPTHTLAAYTSFGSPAWNREYVHQEDTLVLKEHRGRRLGMLVKTANLERLDVEQPEARRIGTWNAEENSFMLSINVTLGFRPAGGSGEWQTKLG
ncbi:GNAT family N-acetyltransferase [Cellulomonas cellasea]|uniref:GNAT superfamily N-acetyltransferase n=1 Tax=Cellulomonas cellasea TaxID=43670 RepID=A0A7W4UFM6_9CELL|nr:GNAT family N-acetyltransferase [Cellulomonas cellasea]MBB2923316.1 GNAT superfamily N-acetyltransferase [Cellulomonas cellasea]